MSNVVSGLGSLVGTANLKTRTVTSAVWAAREKDLVNVKVKNGKMESTITRRDNNAWTKEGEFVDPTTGRKVTFEEKAKGLTETSGNGVHSFKVTYPVVITDADGDTRTKNIVWTIGVNFQKDDEMFGGSQLQATFIQTITHFLGTLTAGEPDAARFARIYSGSEI